MPANKIHPAVEYKVVIVRDASGDAITEFEYLTIEKASINGGFERALLAARRLANKGVDEIVRVEFWAVLSEHDLHERELDAAELRAGTQ